MVQKFLFITLLTICSSCALEEKLIFNSDYSGNTMTKMDLSPMINMLSSMNPSAKSEFYSKILSGIDSLRRTQPLRANMNVQMDSATNILLITHDFKSLDEFNSQNQKLTKKISESLNKKSETSSIYKWMKAGKILIVPGTEAVTEPYWLDPNMKLVIQTLGSVPISFERTFPHRIARVSDDRVTISKDKRTIFFKAELKDLMEKPLKDFQITFK